MIRTLPGSRVHVQARAHARGHIRRPAAGVPPGPVRSDRRGRARHQCHRGGGRGDRAHEARADRRRDHVQCRAHPGRDRANSVRGLAEIEAEARSRDNGKLAALVDSMRMAIEDGARSAGATVEAAIKQEYAAYQVSGDEAIAREAAGAIARAGLEPLARRERERGRQRCEQLQREGGPVRQSGDRNDGHAQGERVDRVGGSPEDGRDRAGADDRRVTPRARSRRCSAEPGVPGEPRETGGVMEAALVYGYLLLAPSDGRRRSHS